MQNQGLSASESENRLCAEAAAMIFLYLLLTARVGMTIHSEPTTAAIPEYPTMPNSQPTLPPALAKSCYESDPSDGGQVSLCPLKSWCFASWKMVDNSSVYLTRGCAKMCKPLKRRRKMKTCCGTSLCNRLVPPGFPTELYNNTAIHERTNNISDIPAAVLRLPSAVPPSVALPSAVPPSVALPSAVPPSVAQAGTPILSSSPQTLATTGPPLVHTPSEKGISDSPTTELQSQATTSATPPTTNMNASTKSSSTNRLTTEGEGLSMGYIIVMGPLALVITVAIAGILGVCLFFSRNLCKT